MLYNIMQHNADISWSFYFINKILSSIFIPGKHKSNLGDNLNNFFAISESPIFLDVFVFLDITKIADFR